MTLVEFRKTVSWDVDWYNRYWSCMKAKLRKEFPMPKDGRVYCGMCCRDVRYLLKKGTKPICQTHDGYEAVQTRRSAFDLELRRVAHELKQKAKKNKVRRDRARRDGPLRGGWYVSPVHRAACLEKAKKPVTRAEFEALLSRCIKLENSAAVLEGRVGGLVAAHRRF